MTARISFENTDFMAEQGETVLDCLTRNGIAVPHACRSGVCQSCLMVAKEGPVPVDAQKGLKMALKMQNLFLACQCKPQENMQISLPAAGLLDTRVTISSKELLTPSVLRLRLTPEQPFPCEPGQYLTLLTDDNVARSYSIANDVAKEGYIELHVRLLTNGAMSAFLQAADVGECLTIRGPIGQCFYAAADGSDYPMVLAGTGCGLAPLYGILRSALAAGHKGAITLYHGALRAADLYLVEGLYQLHCDHNNFRYVPCVLDGDPDGPFAVGNIETVVIAGLPEQKAHTRVFLCGAPDLVNSLKRRAFLAGISSKHIFADAFLPSKVMGHAA